MTGDSLVVIGASAAGLAAAEAARAAGHDGPIIVVGRELDPPYTRPALSKALLHGRAEVDAVILPPPPDDIGLRLGVEATGLDRARGRVRLADGDSLRYDKLVIATGGRARTLRVDGRGETVLRSLADAVALRSALTEIGSVVIVGGGFIALELASACVSAGVRVTVLTRSGSLVAHLGAALSELLTGTAVAHGVTVRRVTGEVTPEGDPVRAIRADDGRIFEADLVVTAIGCRPDTGWIAGSGIPVDGGVLVDERCRVESGISAAGDVARLRGLPRTPFWTAALEQARVAGAVLVRGDEVGRYAPSEFVWTEAFGLTVNVVGPLPAAGPPDVLAGDPDERSALLRWRTDGRGTAAAINHRISRSKLRSVAADAGSSPAA